MAFSHFSFFGVNSLFFIYSNVLLSGAIIPPLAPISMLRLQTVIRPSIDISLNTSPEYSTKHPVAPDVLSSEMINNATSFGVTPLLSLPLIDILIFLGFGCIIH